MKGGNHLLIGTCEVNALDLLITSKRSLPLRRDEKLKGFLEISHFQLHTDMPTNETLEDDSVVSSLQVVESASNDTSASEVVPDVVESNIQEAHPDSPAGVQTRLEFDSPARSIKEAFVVTPDGSPASSPTRIKEQQSPTRGDGQDIAHNHFNQEQSFDDCHEADVSSIATLSMPTLSMQVSLEKLHTGKGKKSLAGKLMKKAPSPFFNFAVLHEDEHSSRW